MSKKTDICDGIIAVANKQKHGLIYTRKCGWIDLGHANPEGGVAVLWRDIKNKTLVEQLAKELVDKPVKIDYRQQHGRWGLRHGVEKHYLIFPGLTASQIKSVALAIFLDVSHSFETLQSNWYYRHITNSGYSGEDLFSNLVGFYRMLYPLKPILSMCEPVSRKIAEDVWDKYGAVGDNKNYSHGPYLFPIEGDEKFNHDGPVCAELPDFLNEVVPAQPGLYFKEIN